MNLLIFNALSWEQRKLGDIADRVTEKNASLEVSETFTNSAEFGIISQRDFFDHDITNKENIGNYFIVRPEDFVYNPRISVTAPVGPINRNKLGRNGVMSPLYTVFRPHDVSNTYLEYFFKTNRWHAFMQFNGDSGARSDRFSIGTDLFYEMPIPAPSFNEQEKIGSFFANLSDLITLHQSKAESWKNKKNQLSTIYWEQRKLGELGKARSGIGFPDAEQGGKEGVPFYKVSDMNNVGNEHEMVAANNYVTREQIARKGWKPIDEVPAIFFAKVGAAVLLNRKRLCRFPFLLDNNTMAYSIDGSALDADFAITLFDTIDLTSLVQVGALPSYNSGDVENIDVVIPEMGEQRKIGAYFKRINSLITLHQRKYEKLQIIKKSMLENCFPKNGEKVPKIRFSGFTGDWEQRKLSDEFSDFIVPMRDKPKEFGGNVPWTRIEDIEGKYLNGTLSDQYVTEETVKKMNLKIIPRDSLIVSSSATFGVVAVVTRDLITNQTFIGLVPNEKETLDYWYAYFYSDEARKYMKLQSAGSTIFYISRESFEIMPIAVPSKAEMMKIGACFDNLDNLITLHHRKLNRTQICINRSFLYGSF